MGLSIEGVGFDSPKLTRKTGVRTRDRSDQGLGDSNHRGGLRHPTPSPFYQGARAIGIIEGELRMFDSGLLRENKTPGTPVPHRAIGIIEGECRVGDPRNVARLGATGQVTG